MTEALHTDAQSPRQPFTAGQKRVFLICFLCYSAAYTGRLNLSAVLASLSAELSLTDARAGAFQTVFALTYAVGQIVNGVLADRVSARRYIAAGLLLSALFNVLFGLARSFVVLVLLWALNGAAQSMLWTPIVKLLTAWFHGERRARASFGISITMILGHMAAWGASGALASALNWRYAFFVPAALMCAGGLYALRRLTDRPLQSGEIDPAEEATAPTAAPAPVGRLLRATGLAALLACCVCNGFVRDGILAWAPSILARAANGQAVDPTLLSLVLPPINLIGVLVVRRCYPVFRSNARGATGALLVASAALAFLLPLGVSALWSALLMGLCCAANYGVNPMLTTLVPMEYERVGRVGMVAGLADSFIYLGSALTGIVTGALSDAAGWNGVYLAWGGVSLLGAALAFLSSRGYRALRGDKP